MRGCKGQGESLTFARHEKCPEATTNTRLHTRSAKHWQIITAVFPGAQRHDINLHVTMLSCLAVTPADVGVGRWTSCYPIVRIPHPDARLITPTMRLWSLGSTSRRKMSREETCTLQPPMAATRVTMLRRLRGTFDQVLFMSYSCHLALL